jgi:hypothetical protein
VPLSLPLDLAHVLVVKYPGRSATGTGTLTAGSNVVTGVSLQVKNVASINSAVSGEGIPPGTTITKVINAESKVELSQNATESGSKSLTLSPAAPPAECESEPIGTVASSENPEADPGFLCVYVGPEPPEGGTQIGIKKAGAFGATSLGSSVSGAYLDLNATGGVGKEFWGTFAVTAP